MFFMIHSFHFHLVSDATGETLNTVAKAASAQFEGIEPKEHIYALVRSERHLEQVIKHIVQHPGIVFFTLVNPELRHRLELECSRLSVPCVSILDRAVEELGRYLGAKESHRPGGQHEMDSRYQRRVEALDFIIQHDDGQGLPELGQADVVLVGASRTSKTPTCVYLAIRGVRAANVPIIPGVELPSELVALRAALTVGLWAAPERLVQIRRQRLSAMGETRGSAYVDEEAVRREVADTRHVFERYGWPAIDVTRRSVEETAAAIMNLLAEKRGT
ncbi:MAG: pyruvate, water dikinase regulatory protein [Alphaproteobacteria bacterium]